MLVVTRKRNEAVVIGDGIEVRVLRAGRDGVRLGITAPPHVAVYRREICDQVRSANATAAALDAPRSVLERLRARVARGAGQAPGETHG